MDGSAFIGVALHATSLSVLLFSLVAHLRNRASLTRELRLQGIARLTIPAAGLLVLAEATLVGIGLSGFATQSAWFVFPRFAGVLYAIFAAYTAVLMIRRPGAPCACGQPGAPVSGWTVTRAILLLIASTLAGSWQPSSFMAREAEAWLALCVGIVTAGLVWVLPSAMRLPQLDWSPPVTREPDR